MIRVSISNVPGHHYLTDEMRKAFTTHMLKPVGRDANQAPDDVWRKQVCTSLARTLKRAEVFRTSFTVRMEEHNDGSSAPGPVIVMVECLTAEANSFDRARLGLQVETVLRPFLTAETEILVHSRCFNSETDVTTITPASAS